MDGRTRYNKIKKIFIEDDGKELYRGDIWRIIMIEIGSTENLIRETFQMMIDLGILTEVRDGYYKVSIKKNG